MELQVFLDANKILQLSRSYSKSQTESTGFDEDRCIIKKGNAARIMPVFRSSAIAIFRILKFKFYLNGIRYFMMNINDALVIKVFNKSSLAIFIIFNFSSNRAISKCSFIKFFSSFIIFFAIVFR